MSNPSIHRDLSAIICAYAGISKKREFSSISANLRDITESHTYLISLQAEDLRQLLDVYIPWPRRVNTGYIYPIDRYMDILKILETKKEGNTDTFTDFLKLYNTRRHFGAYQYYGFFLAICEERLDLVMELLNHDSFDFNTYACEVSGIITSNDKYLEIFKSLIAKKKICIGDSDLKTASKNGCIDMVKWILSQSEKLHPLSSAGICTQKGHINILQILLEYPYIKNTDKNYKYLSNIFEDIIQNQKHPTRLRHKIIKIIIDKLCQMQDSKN